MHIPNSGGGAILFSSLRVSPHFKLKTIWDKDFSSQIRSLFAIRGDIQYIFYWRSKRKAIEVLYSLGSSLLEVPLQGQFLSLFWRMHHVIQLSISHFSPKLDMHSMGPPSLFIKRCKMFKHSFTECTQLHLQEIMFFSLHKPLQVIKGDS